MTQLCDWQIKAASEGGLVSPFENRLVQPASLDIRLSPKVLTENALDWEISAGGHFAMEPGRFLLGSSVEYFKMPENMVARLEGKSTWGRMGLMVHSTAGFIDPGFEGNLTLELKNISQTKPFKLTPGMLIAQVTFHLLAGVPLNLYGHSAVNSHYQYQTGPTPARLDKEQP